MAYTYPLRLLAFSVVRGKSLLISVVLATSTLVSPAPAQALTLRSVPAGWVNIYKSTAPAPKSTQNLTKSSNTPTGAHLDKTSTFVINYVAVPDSVKIAIQAAVDVWSVNFSSSVPITVNATWGRQSSAGILASATPGRYFTGFAGAPDNSLWYPSVLANALAGKDLDPSSPEISIKVNSTVASSLYLGTDGNCPSGQYDLESIILHEMGHGLGFLSNNSFDPFFGYGTIDQPTPFDAYTQLPDGRRLMDVPSPSLELGKALTNTLVWSGPNGVKANNGIKPILYTPTTYEQGSSVSHLDEATFSKSGADAVMTPNLAAGEVFHNPGPILIAMLADMKLKPPAGIASGIPSVPRNVKALIGNKSAIVTFDPPTNARTAQVNSYSIRVNINGAETLVTSSPAVIPNLTNGIAYSFSVMAKNDLGNSDPVTTNAVIPQASWSRTVLDPSADAKYLVAGTFAKKPIVIYSDSGRGDLKMATWNGKDWIRTIIDGNSTVGGRTKNTVAGYISMCSSGTGKTEQLNIFYGDQTDKDLRYASYLSGKWHFEVVDGNGPKVQPYQETARVRTASDVSVSSACVSTPAGLQVFYRDESQGILLGAVRDGTKWRYELIDGDRATDGRTTGDVGFHISALAVGTKVYLVYDSVLALNQDHLPIKGEIRSALRSSAYPEDWIYGTLDATGGATSVAGYAVSLSQNGKSVYATWLAASGITVPVADQIRWRDLTTSAPIISTNSDFYGIPAGPLAIDSQKILFGCSNRLCAISKTDQTIKLVSGGNFKDSIRSQWITFNGARYALVGIGGTLSLFKLI